MNDCSERMIKRFFRDDSGNIDGLPVLNLEVPMPFSPFLPLPIVHRIIRLQRQKQQEEEERLHRQLENSAADQRSTKDHHSSQQVPKADQSAPNASRRPEGDQRNANGREGHFAVMTPDIQNAHDVLMKHHDPLHVPPPPHSIRLVPREKEPVKEHWCECCKEHYTDYGLHVQTEKHVAFVTNDENYRMIDSLLIN